MQEYLNHFLGNMDIVNSREVSYPKMALFLWLIQNFLLFILKIQNMEVNLMARCFVDKHVWIFQVMLIHLEHLAEVAVIEMSLSHYLGSLNVTISRSSCQLHVTVV